MFTFGVGVGGGKGNSNREWEKRVRQFGQTQSKLAVTAAAADPEFSSRVFLFLWYIFLQALLWLLAGKLKRVSLSLSLSTGKYIPGLISILLLYSEQHSCLILDVVRQTVLTTAYGLGASMFCLHVSFCMILGHFLPLWFETLQMPNDSNSGITRHFLNI